MFWKAAEDLGELNLPVPGKNTILYALCRELSVALEVERSV